MLGNIPNKLTHFFTPRRDVSHGGLAIYIKKYLKAKEELCQIFHHAKI
jgi:hypothetical protein